MRIDDDEHRISREKLIDQIRRYQDEQANLDADGSRAAAKAEPQRVDQASASEALRDVQQVVERAREATRVADAGAVEARSQQQAADTQRQTIDGAARSAEAVSAAQQQQTRGEDWQRFQDQDRGSLPTSVEESARAEQQRNDADQQELERSQEERQEQERLSVREIQNDMAVRQRMIRG